MLELINVRKYYNKELILEIPSLKLTTGIYWVRGSNGSGKSTLLKMITGILPFDGDILFEDISQKKDPVKYRQNINWAEAEPLYPSFLTGIDLIRMYGNIRKLPKLSANSLIELFNMTDYINNAIGTYSTGMTKKLSLVMAFMGEAAIIVLDEPLITLDKETLNLVCDLIKDKNKQFGTTFLMSSHQDLDTQLLFTGKELCVSNGTII